MARCTLVTTRIAVQIDLGEPPERIPAMREPIAQGDAINLRMPQLFDPLVGRRVGPLRRGCVKLLVDVDPPPASFRLDLKGAHRASTRAPAPHDASSDRPAATTASTCTWARQSGVCP